LVSSFKFDNKNISPNEKWIKLSELNYLQNFKTEERFRNENDIIIRFKYPRKLILEEQQEVALFLEIISNEFEIFMDSIRIYSYNLNKSSKGNKYYHLLPLEIYKNKINITPTFFLVIPQNEVKNENYLFQIKINSFDYLLDNIINNTRAPIKTLVIAILAFLGVLSVFVYIKRKNNSEKFLLFFGLFSISSALDYFLIVRTNELILLDYGLFYYIIINCLSAFLIPIWFILFFNELLVSKKIIKIFNILKWVFIFFLIAHLFVPIFPEIIIVTNDIHDLFILITMIFFVFTYSKAELKNITKSKATNFGVFIFSVFTIINLFGDIDFFEFIDTNDIYGIGILALVLSFAYSILDQFQKTENKMKEYALELQQNKNDILRLEREELKAKVISLKNQLNPHFLFNTFGTLIDLIEENQNLAIEYVEELSSVYRYMLLSKDKILLPIEDEVEFINSYFFLQSKRFGKNLILEINIKDEVMHKLLPSLSLQLLVENAIKHNIISNEKPLVIKIYGDDDKIVVSNNLQMKTTLEESTGIGLNNIKERYFFYDKKEIEILSTEKIFTVKLPFLNQNHI